MTDKLDRYAAVFVSLIAVAIIIMFATTLAITNNDTAEIGGTSVPANIRCTEDEVIGFVGVDELSCIHYEEVGK